MAALKMRDGRARLAVPKVKPDDVAGGQASKPKPKVPPKAVDQVAAR